MLLLVSISGFLPEKRPQLKQDEANLGLRGHGEPVVVHIQPFSLIFGFVLQKMKEPTNYPDFSGSKWAIRLRASVVVS